MAKTFHQFSDLPKELRLKIWEQTMIEARPDRRIIIYELRVIPFKQLISPLLLVNYESRACAKAFYDFKLDIYAVPPLSDHQIKLLDKETQWARIPGSDKAVEGKIHCYSDRWTRSYFDMLRDDVENDADSDEDWCEDELESESLLEEEHRRIDRQEKEYTVKLEKHWSEFVEEQLLVFGWKSAVKAEKSGPSKGAFYISLEHDVFIDDHECGRHFHNENASTIFGAELIEPQRLACHHISAMLTDVTRERISTLVLVRPRGVKRSRHCVFADGGEFDYTSQPLAFFHLRRENWKQKTFPCVRSHFLLRPCIYNSPGFLQQLIGADGAELSPILEQWVRRGSSVDRSGNTVFRFKQTKGDTYYTFLEEADWVRDLMAHWNDGKDDSVCELLADCDISK